MVREPQGPDLRQDLVETAKCVSLRPSHLQLLSLCALKKRRIWSPDIKNAFFRSRRICSCSSGMGSDMHRAHLGVTSPSQWFEGCAGVLLRYSPKPSGPYGPFWAIWTKGVGLTVCLLKHDPRLFCVMRRTGLAAGAMAPTLMMFLDPANWDLWKKRRHTSRYASERWKCKRRRSPMWGWSFRDHRISPLRFRGKLSRRGWSYFPHPLNYGIDDNVPWNRKMFCLVRAR